MQKDPQIKAQNPPTSALSHGSFSPLFLQNLLLVLLSISPDFQHISFHVLWDIVPFTSLYIIPLVTEECIENQ